MIKTTMRETLSYVATQMVGERRIYVPMWQLNKENLVGKKIEVSGGSRALARQIRSGDIHVLDEENERARKNGSRKNTERVE